MSNWGAGFVIGMAIGFSAGFAAGRKQKPWSELTEKEKKIRIGMIVACAVALVAGVVAFFLVR